jgi:UDP-N-acetylmuramoyl-L-alanyl-D-glutamate--2,6-diaminopimelate ligase
MSPARVESPPITLDRLLAGLIEAPPRPVPAVPVGGLSHDSRAMAPGYLFCALAGSRSHGMRHAAEAVAAGACAILFDPADGGAGLAADMHAVPCWAVDFLDQRLGYLADRYFGEPTRDLEAIGITGTNGKTSCSHFLVHALMQEWPAAVVGTLGWGEPGALNSTRHTTPDAIEVHALLARLVRQGIATVAMEASSHGLVQGRLNGVRFKGGLFTNLSRDHLDYHGDMQAYLEAKLRLVGWPGLEYLVFNLDDSSAPAILARAAPAVRRIGFTRGRSMAPAGCEMLSAEGVAQTKDGLSFLALYGGEAARVSAPLFGDFNVENLLGVLGLLLGRGMGLDVAAKRLSRVRAVPGRMERFSAEGGPSVVVDYAHTPDALDKTLRALRTHCAGSLWLVFGCGGDRDRGKRPLMGAIASRQADRVIVTDDNPRHEEGDAIVEAILAGCEPTEAGVSVLRDRHLAIQTAIEQAGPNDVVLVAGKGHEDYQDIGGVKYPFSDRAIVREALAARGGRVCV